MDPPRSPSDQLMPVIWPQLDLKHDSLVQLNCLNSLQFLIARIAWAKPSTDPSLLPDPLAITEQLGLFISCQAQEPVRPNVPAAAVADADFYHDLNSLSSSLRWGHSPATVALADKLRGDAVARYNAIRAGPDGVTIPLKGMSSQSLERAAAWGHLCKLLRRATLGKKSRAAALELSDGMLAHLSALKTDDAAAGYAIPVAEKSASLAAPGRATLERAEHAVSAGVSAGRKGRLPKAQSEAKRMEMLAMCSTHKTMVNDFPTLAKSVGISQATARRWIAGFEKTHNRG